MPKGKAILALLVLASLVVLVVSVARAEKGDSPADYARQTTCPVMGSAIDSTIYTDMQGQRVYFCCPGCIEAFRADPEKYFMKAAEEKIMFENVQKACPVTGEPVDGKTFIYYKGRGLYFCCAKCKDDFKADPGKYLLNMDKKPEAGEEKGQGADGAGREKKHGDDAKKGVE